MAIRANAGGTSARLTRRGHLSHGANQMAIPRASATALTAAVAATSNPGAGSGSVTSPSTPAPAKNNAANRPTSLRRSGGPPFNDPAPAGPASAGGLWIRLITAKRCTGRAAASSTRCTGAGRLTCVPPQTTARRPQGGRSPSVPRVRVSQGPRPHLPAHVPSRYQHHERTLTKDPPATPATALLALAVPVTQATAGRHEGDSHDRRLRHRVQAAADPAGQGDLRAVGGRVGAGARGVSRPLRFFAQT